MGQFILETGWMFGWLVAIGVAGMAISDKVERMPKMPHTLGDKPIEKTYREKMHRIVGWLDLAFNGRVGGPGRKTGFVLLVFPFNESDGRCNYISNGANRDDIVVMMKEQIKRFEGQPDIEGRA